VCESRHEAHELMTRAIVENKPLVIKPLFGSQGNGVRLMMKSEALPVPMEAHVDGLYYLQRYVDSGEGAWHDHRVFVIQGKAIAAMVRHGESWVNNVALGGRCEAVAHDGELEELAEAAANAVDIDYCGVDIIRDCDGKLFVLEVNSIPAWRGLQGVANVDIAQALVDDCLGLVT
jgi:RimK family alpha-L-glutamate ligase